MLLPKVGFRVQVGGPGPPFGKTYRDVDAHSVGVHGPEKGLKVFDYVHRSESTVYQSHRNPTELAAVDT